MMLQYLPLVIVYCVRYHMLACTMLVWRRIINFSPFDNCVTVHSFQAKLDVEEIYSETWQTSPWIWKRQRYRLIFSQNCQACLNPYRYGTVWVEFFSRESSCWCWLPSIKGVQVSGAVQMLIRPWQEEQSPCTDSTEGGVCSLIWDW